jgi:hypothetical protein
MGDPIVGLVGALCLVCAALVALIAVYQVRRQRRRRRQTQQWADHNGWTLTRNPRVEWGRLLPGGNRHGISHTFSRVIEGRRVNVAQYSVTDASDGTTTNTHYHVVAVVVLSRSYPSIQVEPRGRASRLKNKLLGPGETASGNPDFDREFIIRTSEASAVRQWLSPALTAAQLNGRIPAAWSVHGTELLCHRPGELNPDDVPGYAGAALSLATLLEPGSGNRP